jgi:hypothetical protein
MSTVEGFDEKKLVVSASAHRLQVLFDTSKKELLNPN